MVNLKKETYLKILFLLSITILVFAYAVQFILGYQPCSLCILERIPYVLSIIILILNYNFRKDEFFYCILLMITFAFSFLISVYHFGIEQEFINESSICVANNVDLITKDDILKSLGKVTVNCKNVAFQFTNALSIH